MLRVIFPNRWLIWTIFIALCAAIFSWWATALFSIEEDNQARYFATQHTKSNSLRYIVVPRSAEDTSSWKTYRNEKYGFEVKIPFAFTVSQEHEHVEVKSSTDSSGSFALDISSLRKRDNDFTVDEFAFGAKDYQDMVQIINREKTVLNGFRAFKYDLLLGHQTNHDVFFLKNDDEGISVSYMNEYFGDQREINENKEIFEKVISTFKFIEPQAEIDISSWKTYRSEKYGFEFKYPSDWEASIDVFHDGYCDDFQYPPELIDSFCGTPHTIISFRKDSFQSFQIYPEGGDHLPDGFDPLSSEESRINISNTNAVLTRYKSEATQFDIVRFDPPLASYGKFLMQFISPVTSTNNELLKAVLSTFEFVP